MLPGRFFYDPGESLTAASHGKAKTVISKAVFWQVSEFTKARNRRDRPAIRKWTSSGIDLGAAACTLADSD
ncbi:MAG: hypothetical protein ACI8P0_002330 [Planctomycetaceae bacterium]|jgi:hypothetical protein